MSGKIDAERFPEWQPFVDAVQQRRPDAGTWCEAWTVRDIVVHQAGNAEELARVLGAHLTGEPVATRGFEEREAPLRAMNETDLWAALHRNMAPLNEAAEAADDVPADTDVAWTGRTMKVPWFAEHMREELVLHGWDITGDDVVVSADTDSTSIGLADPDGPATLETDAAARVLLLWGRRPADPSRICSRVGPQSLGRVRALLAGY
jgi:hypothetical protein